MQQVSSLLTSSPSDVYEPHKRLISYLIYICSAPVKLARLLDLGEVTFEKPSYIPNADDRGMITTTLAPLGYAQAQKLKTWTMLALDGCDRRYQHFGFRGTIYLRLHSLEQNIRS